MLLDLTDVCPLLTKQYIQVGWQNISGWMPDHIQEGN
jgi:hypothetical protein